MVDEVGHSNEELVTISSLEAYFHDSMDAALATNRVALDDHTTHYVVNLLTLFSRSDELYEDDGETYGIRPLALMLADAAERMRRSRLVGWTMRPASHSASSPNTASCMSDQAHGRLLP